MSSQRWKRQQYTCCRCQYQTEDKSHMRKHLYNTAKVCPAQFQDIELTDIIKEYILKNRVYRPHVINVKQSKNTASKNIKVIVDAVNDIQEQSKDGYFYVLQEREFIHKNEPVYKIGRTINPSHRLSKYPAGSQVLFMCEVPDYKATEQAVIDMLDEKFKKRRDIGAEYYEADSRKLLCGIMTIINGILCTTDNFSKASTPIQQEL
jgi:hypothetical protein